jgi:hypothetical protein
MTAWVRKPGSEDIRHGVKRMATSVPKCAHPGCVRQAGMVGGMTERARYCSITCAGNHRHLLAKIESSKNPLAIPKKPKQSRASP